MYARKLSIEILFCTIFFVCSVQAKPIIPIIYRNEYNISFLGIENLHPFDTKKYGKIAAHLQETCHINPNDFQKPEQITDTQLALVQTPAYLTSLTYSKNVAKIAEVAPLKYLPNFMLQRNMLSAMRYATGGTVLGAQLALDHGWAINLSGGYHHAKTNKGEGFCFFADIPLAIKKLRIGNPNIKVLVVDLDAHQGNGLEEILGKDQNTFIFDMYSENNYPHDSAVMKYIDFNYPLVDHIQDAAYMSILKENLPNAIQSVQPDLIIYNAGSDIYEKDPLGKMSISQEGIIERDLFLFTQAQQHNTPILMVLSGGYSPESAAIVGTSIENVIKKLKLLATITSGEDRHVRT